MKSRGRLALRVLGLACIAGVVATCQDSQFPVLRSGAQPSFALSDGSNGPVGTRNTDVFFNPPLVGTPSGPGYGDRSANPNLLPVARLCKLNATESNPDPNPLTCLETLSPDLPMAFNQTGQYYQANLKDGGFALNNDHMYRIDIRVGSKSLAYRDIDPDANPPTASCTNDPFCQFNSNSNIPIKVRIESAALCFLPNADPSTPGTFTLPCASASLAAGGSVVLQDGETVVGSVVVQSGGGSAPSAAPSLEASGGVSVVTLRACESNDPRGAYLNPAFIDLPTFGDCVDIETDPPLSSLGNVGIASLCEALNVAAAAGLSEAQRHRITVHNLTNAADGIVVALPDADGFCPAPSPAPSSIGLSPFNRLLQLAQEGWHTLRAGVIPWLGPESLWASLLCDRGCGGFNFESPVQAALPAKMGYPASTPGGNLGTSLAGSTVPVTVQVTDAGNDPVAGAKISFSVTAGSGSVSPTSFITGANGIATANWTIGEGNNSLTASARGVADPSCATDPNYPCGPQGVFASSHLAPTQPKVTLGTGHLSFGAFGCVPGSASGTARVDGVLGSAEWQCARTYDFSANVSGGSTPATLYVMNDANNLYLAVKLRRSSTDKVNTLQFNFDNNGNWNSVTGAGAAETNDDVLSFDGGSRTFTDAFLTLKCSNSSQSSCWQTDGSAGGASNGSAAFGNDGTYSTYEMAHPLRGDTYDFSRSAGNQLGLFLTLQTGNGATGNTQWPGFRRYLEFTIK